MKKGSHQRFRLHVLAFSLLPLFSSCGTPASMVSYRFASKGADFGDSVYFEDSLFSSSSFEYNPTLANTSLSFAMACFASSDNRHIDSLTRYSNAESLLSSAGFTSFFANSDFHKRSASDTIGLVFAKKPIGDKTLIYAGIRGANYEMEWASNLSIAEPGVEYDYETASPYHYGFHKAAQQLINELSTYIINKGITGDIKLWTSGFSRAGATANIVGGLLDQAIDKGEKPLGNNVNLKKEDLYVYCFEPPMGAPVDIDQEGNLKSRGEQYGNIYSHINFDDPVPLVAMKEVGYTRFGKDRYYPNAISYRYPKRFIDDMRVNFANNEAYSARGGDYLIDNFVIKKLNGLSLTEDTDFQNWTQGLFLREFVSLLTIYGLKAGDIDKIGVAKTNYVKNIQPAARTIFNILYRTGTFKGSFIDFALSMVNSLSVLLSGDIETLIVDLTHSAQKKYVYEDLMVIVSKGAKKLGIEFTSKEVKNDIKALVDIIASFISYCVLDISFPQLIVTWFSPTMLASVASGHYPEISLSAIKALDPRVNRDCFNNTNPDGKHYVLTFPNRFAKVRVYKDGVLIGSAESREMGFASVPARVAFDGVKFILPYEEGHYEFECDENAECEVSLFDYTKYGEYVSVTPTSISPTRYSI